MEARTENAYNKTVIILMKWAITMTTEQLQYFMTLATHMNYSSAAEHLFISQSTLSRNISAFEEEIGAKLLIRSNNRVSLTAAGRLLKERAPKLLEQMRMLQVDCRSLGDGQTGRFYIGIPNWQQINDRAYEALAEFRRRNPKVSVVFNTGEQEELLQQLVEGACDVMLTVQFFDTDFPGMQTLQYGVDEPVLMVPCDHPNAGLAELSLTQIPPEISDTRCLLSRVAAAFWEQYLPQDAALQLWPMVGKDGTLMTSLAGGEGVTLINRCSVLNSCPTMRALKITDPLPPLRLVAVYPPNSENSLTECFRACLAELTQ